MPASVACAEAGRVGRLRIEGAESFRGEAFHSAEWDPSCDLRGNGYSIDESRAEDYEMAGAPR